MLYDKRGIKKVYADAFEKSGLTTKESNYQWPIIIRSGVNEKEEVLHFIFNYSSDTKMLKCPYEKTIDLLTGTVYLENEMIEMTDWDVRILKEIRE